MKKNAKREITAEVIGAEISKMVYSAKSIDELRQLLDNTTSKTTTTTKISISREVAYITARYLKFQRGLA